VDGETDRDEWLDEDDGSPERRVDGLGCFDIDNNVLIDGTKVRKLSHRNHEKAKSDGAGGEGDSIRAYGIPHGHRYYELHGSRTALKIED